MLNSSIIAIIVYFANHTQLPNVKLGLVNGGIGIGGKSTKLSCWMLVHLTRCAMGGSVTCM